MTLTKHTFAKGIKILSVLLGSDKVNLDKRFNIEIWYASLLDLDDDQFQKACIYLVQNTKWHPSIAEIRETAQFIYEATQGNSYTAEGQWQVFKDAVTSHPGAAGLEKFFERGEQFFDDPVTNSVAQTIYKDFATSNISETGNWRARFISSYNNTKSFGNKTAQVQRLDNIISIVCNKKKELSHE
ncbi:hypothetical protein Dacet_1088 [Denitrovibrio acetiphilus DSM 12809]|uniref:Uncharacterized protein n=1 Tax=Denitrovibrio acetiphilus (strain DSM 12809 / NBRC 114555 / N2460) TaxID=522772 RepID=D4H6Z4_DENA2|nr:hypothetical protein [Denitrovibrio acetiphilus]ADD67860.1 hypothetical protein Dacet_1088 [Denitrovibrio acetiphilus DSM 12809]